MSVFFIHEPAKGYITPLDRKFLVRDIPLTSALVEAQKIHEKISTEHEEQNKQHTASPEKKHSGSRQLYQAYQEQTSKAVLTVGQFMSHPVLSISVDKTLLDAWKLMKKYEIHHLAIVDKHQNLVGLLSTKQLSEIMMDTTDQNFKDIQLIHFCQAEIITASPDTSIDELASVFLELGIDGMIVYADQEIAGIITRSDILKIFLAHRELNTQA